MSDYGGIYAPVKVTTEYSMNFQRAFTVKEECLHCHKPFSKEDRFHGFIKAVVIDGIESDICLPCVELVLEDWVRKHNDVGALKVS